jgi:membrane protein
MERPLVFWNIIKEASSKWVDDNVPQLAAALAFYTIFSLAPLLIFGIYVTGLIFGPQAARGELLNHIQNLMGGEATILIRKLVVGGSRFQAAIPATIIAVVTMIIGATAVFVELQNALDKIWDVKPASRGILFGIIKARLVSFAMILGIGFLFLVSLLSTAIIGAVGHILRDLVPRFYYLLVNLGTGSVSFLLITALFAMIFKLLPEAKTAWKPAWIGAFITSVFFTIGKFLIGMYITRSGTGSAYGAAGSLAVFIFWVYYSAQVFYSGAEITRAYARHYDANIPQINSCKESGNKA